jgi:hypothetical protein
MMVRYYLVNFNENKKGGTFINLFVFVFASASICKLQFFFIQHEIKDI